MGLGRLPGRGLARHTLDSDRGWRHLEGVGETRAVARCGPWGAEGNGRDPGKAEIPEILSDEIPTWRGRSLR